MMKKSKYCMLSLNNFKPHFKISYQTPNWVSECSWFIYFDKSMTDPSEEISTNYCISNFLVSYIIINITFSACLYNYIIKKA